MTQLVKSVALLITVSGYCEAGAGCEARRDHAGCAQGVRVALLKWSSQLHFKPVALLKWSRQLPY